MTNNGFAAIGAGREARLPPPMGRQPQFSRLLTACDQVYRIALRIRRRAGKLA